MNQYLDEISSSEAIVSVCSKPRLIFALLLNMLAATILCSCENSSATKDSVNKAAIPGGTVDSKSFNGICSLSDSDPEFAQGIACQQDYAALAARPMVASVPGAMSVKTLIDRLDGNRLYFLNSRRYPIHYDFASAHVSGNGLPLVSSLSNFNQLQYYNPQRRFLLGALNYYEAPGIWAYEIAPYDTADAQMIESAFRLLQSQFWLGNKLVFHPTSDMVLKQAQNLPDDIPVIATDRLFGEYQPLNLGTAMGKLRFFRSDKMDDAYVSFRDIAVLQSIPNDISACAGIITGAFQTPLSHINVLAQNRGTPNMAAREAFNNEKLRSLEGKWVSLTVEANGYSIHEVSREQADIWWKAHQPTPIEIPKPDLSVTDLRDIENVLDLDANDPGKALKKAILAFGGKASHFAAFPHITEVAIPYPKAFVVPIYYYKQFMTQNGFDERVRELIQNKQFQDDVAYRKVALASLRADMEAAPVDANFEAMLIKKIAEDFGAISLRFRSSTNAEDLDGFTGAGLYTSKTGQLGKRKKHVLRAARRVWASIWSLRAFEEREFRGISHEHVGMALLVHRSFPNEDANGVAITDNIYDTTATQPGFYVNVQKGESSVVLPPTGITSDQFIYHFDMPGQPITYLAHSSLTGSEPSVLTRSQALELGKSLSAIHRFFSPVYGPSTAGHYYAMDVEFKFNTDADDPEQASRLVIKQARPYPGRGDRL